MDLVHQSIMISKQTLDSDHRGTESLVTVLGVSTLAITATTWGTLLYVPVATIVSKNFGVSTTAIGYQVGLAYFSAMISSLFAGNLTIIIGARWTVILAIILTGLGSLVTTTYSLTGMFIGTVLIGFGHGLINPASAVLLSNIGKNSRRSLIFSIKQSGTPLGGILTAIVTPSLLENYDWQYAGYALASVCFVFALCVWWISQGWNGDRSNIGSVSFNPLYSVATIVKSPSLRVLMIMAVCYSSMQLCVMTFFSPYFIEELSKTLLISGTLLATIHVSGGVGRLFFGWLSDYMNDNVLILRILGIVTALSCLSTFFLSTNTNISILFLLCVVLGGTSIGWNGLFMAEIINLTEKGNASHATAGMTSFTFTAATLGPFLFAFIKNSVGSFGLTIAMFAIVAGAGSLATWGPSRNRYPQKIPNPQKLD